MIIENWLNFFTVTRIAKVQTQLASELVFKIHFFPKQRCLIITFVTLRLKVLVLSFTSSTSPLCNVPT